jgi:hypothetical protein
VDQEQADRELEEKLAQKRRKPGNFRRDEGIEVILDVMFHADVEQLLYRDVCRCFHTPQDKEVLAWDKEKRKRIKKLVARVTSYDGSQECLKIMQHQRIKSWWPAACA